MQFDAALATATRSSTAAAPRRTRQRRSAGAPLAIVEFGFGWLAALCDFGAVVLAAAVSHLIYRWATFGLMPNVEPITEAGVVIGALVVISNLQRNEYSIKRFHLVSGHIGRCASVWNLAFLGALALGFATKTTDAYSRGAMGALYVVGLLTLYGTRLVLVGAASVMKSKGMLPRRRMVVVGFESQLSAFLRRYDLSSSGMEIVCAPMLRDEAAFLADDLALAAASVRMLRPDHVVIAVPWSQPKTIEACVDTFLRTPAEIQSRSRDDP